MANQIEIRNVYADGRKSLGLCLCLPGVIQAQYGSHNPVPVPGTSCSTDVIGLDQVTTPVEVRLDDGDAYKLEAKTAKQKIGNLWIKRLAYNGSVPGPIFRVRQGSSVKIALKNSTEVATTLHPHGLRVESRFDGVPGVGQEALKTGQSYAYLLKFPDAGIFWYHPHVREDYAQESGLYGVFIVEPANPEAYNPVHCEIPLVLGDVLVDPKQPFLTDKVTHTLMGRFGNVNLVNGTQNPTIAITKGEVIRFFTLNTSNPCRE